VKRHFGGRFALVGIMAAGVLGAAGLAPGVAHAANGYSGAQYQVTFALNCNHPGAPCQHVFGYGGIWGWIAVMPGGTTNAQITECGHTIGGGGPGSAGATHTGYDGTWTEISSPSGPPSPITPVDPNGKYLVFTDSTSAALSIPPVPATDGHYSISFAGAEGQETIAP
jgi:hypothetical protein